MEYTIHYMYLEWMLLHIHNMLLLQIYESIISLIASISISFSCSNSKNDNKRIRNHYNKMFKFMLNL